MDYEHVKKQLGYGIQTESKDNAIKALEQLQAKVVELSAEVERLSVAHVKACQANADSQAELVKATKPLEEEVERLKGIKNVQLDIYPNDAGTKQQREVDGSLEMGQLLADSKNEETGNPKAERAKSLVWMHTGGGHIADSSGKRIGIFSGDFKHRDRLICAVNSESDLLAQLAAAQEEGATVTSERDNLWFKLETAKAELADLRDQLAKTEQRVAEYNELIYAVQTKNPDETRHQTALRYIRNAENRQSYTATNGASS